MQLERARVNKIVLAPTSLPTVTPLDYLAAAADAGYHGVGMRLYPASPSMPFTPIVGDASLMREVKQTIARSGLAVHDLFSWYLRPETDFDGLQPALEYGAELGARYAVVICDEPEWARAVDNLGRLADLAAKFALTAVVEGPIYGRLINTLPLVLRLVEEAGRDNVGVCVDTYQLFRSGASADSLQQVDPEVLAYVQLTDGLVEPVGFLVPGQGSVPVREMAAALPTEMVIGLECPPPKGSQVAPTDWARAVLAGARDALSQRARSEPARRAS
jgi:sugar phosphate isomerase/epimerase